MIKSPILIICYRRFEYTEELLHNVLEYNPLSLYVFCDGSSGKHDITSVQKTKNIIKKFDVNKTFKKHFEHKNLGCGRGVKKALDWFFSENKYGIILEDDIMPTDEFFSFMDENLFRYADDSSIASVNGFCPWPDFFRPNVPVLKSKYFSMWGWGTWARVWKNYKLDVDDTLQAQWSKAIRTACESDNENEFWQNVLVKIKNKEIDTWDYQFFFQAWANNQVHIRPPNNLVRNLGFGADATHTGLEPWFIKAQNMPLTSDEPHWFLDAAYFYFRHLTFLDNGSFCRELVNQQVRQLTDENRELRKKLSAMRKNPLKELFKPFFKK